MAIERRNSEVWVARDAVVRIRRADAHRLKKAALQSPRKRVRICAHAADRDALQEMFIVMARGTYVRPHRHLGKAESFHILEGAADVVLFDRRGKITDVIPLGVYGSGRPFYYRISTPLFHTLVIKSRFLIFHEATTGPFDRTKTVFPSWAPDGSDPAAARRFMLDLKQRLPRVRR